MNDFIVYTFKSQPDDDNNDNDDNKTIILTTQTTHKHSCNIRENVLPNQCCNNNDNNNNIHTHKPTLTISHCRQLKHCCRYCLCLLNILTNLLISAEQHNSLRKQLSWFSMCCCFYWMCNEIENDNHRQKTKKNNLGQYKKSFNVAFVVVIIIFCN